MPALVSALKSVDLPTLGRPTMPHLRLMVGSLGSVTVCKLQHRVRCHARAPRSSGHATAQRLVDAPRRSPCALRRAARAARSRRVPARLAGMSRGWPMPMRSRQKSCVPSAGAMSLSPLCPESPPPNLSFTSPGGRSSSSCATRISSAGDAIEARERADRAAGLVHEGVGLEQPDVARPARAPPRPGSAPRAASRARAARATSSTHQKPALWRVASYFLPGLPRPTMSFMMRIAHCRYSGKPTPRRATPDGASPRRPRRASRGHGALLLVAFLLAPSLPAFLLLAFGSRRAASAGAWPVISVAGAASFLFHRDDLRHVHRGDRRIVGLQLRRSARRPRAA